MNLFLLPSWYPSATQPLGGVFTQEQAQALAELAPDINVIASLWGQGDGHLPLRRPMQMFDRLLWRTSQHKDQVQQRSGVWEVFNPKLYWSDRLPWAGARQFLQVNRRNFQLAQQRFGKIDLIHAHVSCPGGYIASPTP